MKILIKNGKVQQNNQEHITFENKNIVIENDMITGIFDNNAIQNQEFNKVIDANSCIVMPGLVNSHLHSSDHFNKGAFDNLPLELWVLYLRPIFSGFNHTPDEIYLRTLLGSIEMIKTGTTSVIDDVVQFPALDEKNLSMVFKGYEKAGIRAAITSHLINKPLYKTIPFLEESLNDTIKSKLTINYASEKEMLSYVEQNIRKYNKKDAVQTYALAPSGPQRCSIELMTGLKKLSQKYKLPVISHVLETKVQEVTAKEFYNMTMVEYLKEHDLLYANLNLVHSVWVSDKDIEQIKEHNSKIIHNPTSNLKLGSGIAPIKRFLDKGISIGLGTDNTSSNDSLNMFELMKITGLIHKVQDHNYEKWVGAQDALKMATIFGAECALKDNEFGSIDIGKKADLIILETDNHRFIPCNNYVNQVAFCENGSSVKTVLINGEIVMEDKVIKTFNEEEVLQEVQGVMSKIFKERNLSCEQAELIFDEIKKAYYTSNEFSYS